MMFRSMTICALLLAAGAAWADLDYVAINRGDTSRTYIFTYDTNTTALSQVTSVNWTITLNGNTGTKVSAGPGGTFWTGASGAGAIEGVERWAPDGAKTTWTSEFGIDIAGETGANEFYDSSVRGAVNTDSVNPGAAELASGRFMVAEARIGAYAVGDRSGAWSGTLTDAFIASTPEMGILNPGVGSVAATNAAQVVSTVAGSSDRFIVTSNMRDTAIMVYNANGSKQGELTNLTVPTYKTTYSAVGTMKTAGMGDVVLQLASDRSLAPVGTVEGRSVADGSFDSVVVTAFTIGNAPWIEFSDVDGTESGLIMVVGATRRGGIGDSVAIQFFNPDGSAHSPLFHLRDINGDFAIGTASTYASGAGLIFVPEPATMGLLGLGFAGLVALRRRRRQIEG